MSTLKSRGFSLIELMIAVAIVAILAAIAYPSYQEHVRKSRRADCAGALTGLANAMERHFTINTSYLAAAAGGANTGAPAIYSTQCPVDGSNATYNLRITAATQNTFTIQAQPIASGPQAGDKCGSLTLNQLGQKGQTGAGMTVADCW